MTMIVLNGPAEITLLVGDEFVDPGAVATATDGTTDLEVQVAGWVETHEQSQHTLVYSAIDDAGNFVTASRTVVVHNDEGAD